MKKIAFLAFLLGSLAAHGQLSVVTSTLTDTDGTAWANGTCTVTLQWSTTKYPTTTPYRKDLGPGTLVPQHPACTVNGSGVLSVTVTDVRFVYPPNSTWLFTVCPNVYQGNLGCGVTQVPVTGSSVDLTGTLKVPAARVGGGIGAFAYADLEVAPLWNNFYWNTTSGKCRQWQNSWADCGSGAAGVPGAPNMSVQFNNSGVFGGDSSLTFNPATKALTLGPLGTANSGANFNSGILSVCGSYFNVTPLAACFTLQDTVTTGTTPYSVIQLGFNSPGGGQFNFPFSDFLDGFIQQGFNSGGVQFQAANFSGNYKLVWPPQNPTAGNTFFSCTPISSAECDAAWVPGGGGSGAVTPQSFGAFGDAVSVANGCTTNGTTTVVCPAGPFASGDVGKEIDIWGAGAAGVSFKANIAAFTSNTTVTVSATPATNVTQNPSVFGHDDAAAIQSCWNASSVNGVQCIMGTATPSSFLTPAGYLVSSAGLTIPTHANITGNSFYEGTTIFGEFNGDLVSLPTSTASVGAGQPIVGVNFANLELYMDPTLANGRGIHLNAAGGVFGPGGIYASTFSNVMVESAAKECLWSDGSVTGADLPNQVLTFNMFYCNLPNQMHTAAAINITGSHAQIIFQNGQINGSTTHSNEPNPLISFTGSGGKFPVDVKFIGYTCEVATTCLYFGPNTSNLHYDNGYMEQVDNALIADTGAQGFTFNGNYLPNVGSGTAVAQFLGGVTGAMRDNTTAGGTPTAWATCSGATNVVLQSGNHSSNLQTSGCALSIAVSGGTQNANSCSADTNITMPGITTDSVVTVGYSAASEAGVAGWGTTGGMRILARPSAANTMSWHLCNPTSGNITYGAYTFKWGFTQQ